MSWFKKIFSRDSHMNEHDFAQYYSEALSQTLATPVNIDWTHQSGEARFVLTIEGTELALSFANRYALYRQNPAALDNYIQQDIDAIHETATQINHPQPMESGQIFPVIKHQSWAESGGNIPSADDEKRDNIIIPLIGDLILTFALDSENAIRYIRKKDLPDLGIADIDDLHAQAISNFAAYTATHLQHERDNNGIYHFTLDEIYEASLYLFAKAIIAQLPEPLESDAIIALPARNHFMLCDLADSKAVSILQNKTQHIAQTSAFAVSDLLYRVDAEGNIEVYSH